MILRPAKKDNQNMHRRWWAFQIKSSDWLIHEKLTAWGFANILLSRGVLKIFGHGSDDLQGNTLTCILGTITRTRHVNQTQKPQHLWKTASNWRALLDFFSEMVRSFQKVKKNLKASFYYVHFWQQEKLKLRPNLCAYQCLKRRVELQGAIRDLNKCYRRLTAYQLW